MADRNGDGLDDVTGKPVIPQSGSAERNQIDAEVDALRNGTTPSVTWMTDVPNAVNQGAAEMNNTSAGGDDPWVLRPGPVEPHPTEHGGPTIYHPAKPTALDIFQGEYAKNIEDPNFQTWLVTRGWAFGRNLITKDGRFNTTAGRQFWDWLGDVVAKNPDVRKTVTPEAYADGRYAAVGGDQAFMDAGGNPSATEKEKENPIYTSTSTSKSYNLMPNDSAEAAVDSLARALLGRMASDKELNRYRKQINSFLKANPSISTSTTVSNSDTNTSKTNTVSKSGASPSDAVNILEMRLRRGSEGMAFNAGKMIEDALTGIDRGL